MIRFSKSTKDVSNQNMGLVFEYLNTLKSVVASTDVKGESCDTLQDGLRVFIQKAVNANENGNKLIFVGNGGSAGICTHSANDYAKNGGFRSTALHDGAVLTCLGNDFGFENIFSRQLSGIGNKGDVLYATSTSGASENVLQAILEANKMGISVICLTGENLTNMSKNANVTINTPSSDTNYIQEMHIAIGQLICGIVEDHFFKNQ